MAAVVAELGFAVHCHVRKKEGDVHEVQTFKTEKGADEWIAGRIKLYHLFPQNDAKPTAHVEIDDPTCVAWGHGSHVMGSLSTIYKIPMDVEPTRKIEDASASAGGDPQRQPQPPPVNKGKNVPEAFRTWALWNHKPIEAIVLSKSRDDFGQAKYGQPLMSEDGRDSVEDAMDEIGDFFHYLYKAKMNGEDVRRLARLIDTAKELLEDPTPEDRKKGDVGPRSRDGSRSPPPSTDRKLCGMD